MNGTVQMLGAGVFVADPTRAEHQCDAPGGGARPCGLTVTICQNLVVRESRRTGCLPVASTTLRVASVRSRANRSMSLRDCIDVGVHSSRCTSGNATRYHGAYDSDGQAEGCGAAKYPNGDSYAGKWHNGQRSGSGTLKFGNGDVYQGEWSNDERSGYGEFKSDESNFWGHYEENERTGPGKDQLANGECYIGMYKNGVRHGSGQFFKSDGSILSVRWENDKPCNEQGTIISSTGNFVEGVMQDGQLVKGDALIHYANRDYYRGSINNGQRNGRGRMEYYDAEGSRSLQHVFEGEWLDDMHHGQGTMTDDEGLYSGSWQKGVRVGQGKMCYHDGNTFTGTWENDKPHGTGRMLFATQEVYAGQFMHGKMTSTNSTYEYNTGQLFLGKFVDGKRFDGPGVLKYRAPGKEDVYTGNFVADARHGVGEIIYSNGDSYSGQWHKDKRQGSGVEFLASSNVQFDGPWFRGKRTDGPGLQTFCSSGDTYRGQWKDMMPHGKGHFINLVRPGSKAPDDPKEVIEFTGEVRKGKKHGTGTRISVLTYAPQGVDNSVVLTATFEGTFENDKIRDGSKGSISNFNGDVYTGDFHSESYHGFGTMTYQNGDSFEGTWANGKRVDGPGRMNYANGDRYDCEWLHELQHGKGSAMIVTRSGFDSFVGTFFEGKCNGVGRMSYSNGDYYSGLWAGGERHGRGYLFYRGGNYFLGQFLKGFCDGESQCVRLFDTRLRFQQEWSMIMDRIFPWCEAPVLEKLIVLFHERELVINEPLICQGHTGSEMFIVLSGELQSESGSGTVCSGGSFGNLRLVADAPAEQFICTAAARVIFLSQADFLAVRRANCDLEHIQTIWENEASSKSYLLKKANRTNR